jgi:hypothetical protein
VSAPAIVAAQPMPLGSVAAAGGLAGAMLDVPQERLDEAGWHRLVTFAHREGLSGHLLVAAERGLVPASDAQVEVAEEAHRSALDETAVAQHVLLDLAVALDGQGVPFRILGAPAMGRLVYPDPSRRPFRDLELLVDPTQRVRALDILHRLGLRPPVQRTRHARADGDVLVAAPGGPQVLVRGHLPALRRSGHGRWAGWALPPAMLPFPGQVLPALAPEVALLHASWSAAQRSARGNLAALRDVAELALAGRPTLTQAVTFAARAGAERCVAEALRAAWVEFRVADVVPLSVWARALR